METNRSLAFRQALLLFGLLLLPSFSKAQFFDTFLDGDFSQNPVWTGHEDKFAVIDAQLQLKDTNATSSNVSFLSAFAPTSLNSLTTWEFYFRLQFEPSSSNFGRFYLAASLPDLSSNPVGYFLKLGGASGDVDALALYRQDAAASTATLLWSGPAGALAAEPAQARVRVSRSPEGLWSIWADYTGAENWQWQGEVQDATYAQNNFSGIYCKYTSSRNEHFFFDDIRISPLYQDTSPPVISQILAPSATRLAVYFSEALAAAQGFQNSTFRISPGIGPVNSVQLDNDNPALVWLDIGTPLVSGFSYALEIDSIADTPFNWAYGLSMSFNFYDIQQAEPGDILITEIMADPSPPQILPNAEYLELFNKSEKVVQLENWQLKVGNTSRNLPGFLFLPGTYIIVCDTESADFFSSWGTVLGLEGLPGLTNGGATLELADAQGAIQTALTYNDKWYGDDLKSDGGWSLEQIQLEGPQDCAGNWQASISQAGGTPGAINSTSGISPDSRSPLLVTAIAQSATEVLLIFDEPLQITAAEAENCCTLSGGINISSLLLEEPEAVALKLFLDSPMLAGQLYTITIDSLVGDCMNNRVLPGTSIATGLSENPVPGDLIINEVLFNPQIGGKDFVELYNKSTKIINLKSLRLANTQALSTNNIVTIESEYLIFPGAYVVLTEDKEDLQARYHILDPQALIAQFLPGLDDTEGNVSLKSGLITLDSFDYRADMHSALISGPADGISLERISTSGGSNEPANWHSAAGSVGFATPTSLNSQALPTAFSEGLITLSTGVFSPDGDGYEDLLLIGIMPEQTGAILNLEAFDARGRKVRSLARNALLGVENQFKWDGSTNEGLLAGIGIYIIWAELFTPNGQVRHYLRSCVLAGRLK